MRWDFWLVFLVLAVLLPWRGRARLQKMLALPEISSRTRLQLYASTIAFQWIAAAVTAWRAFARGLHRAQLGLTVHGAERILIASIVGALTLGTLQWLNLRRLGRTPGKARDFMQKLAQRILPQSPVELPVYLALAATAGLCEEFIYRGFAIAALDLAGVTPWLIILISAILFGLAHLYQGRGGFVGTFLIGVVFGIARIAYDGLVPVMAWHFAVDAAAGIAGPKYLVRSAAPDADAEVPVPTETS